MGFGRVRTGVEEVFIIVVQDQDGMTKEKWTALKKDFPKVIKILDDKYGLNVFKPKVKDKKDKDLDWALS